MPRSAARQAAPTEIRDSVHRVHQRRFLEHVALDMPLPDMPIFLNPERYVNVPLEATYLEAWKGMPSFWRNVVLGKPVG